MKQEFFTNLPSEMIINILSRLPARAATSCKCVCKPWLNILESAAFAKSHMSKSVPGLALQDEKSLTLLEFEDDRVLDREHHEPHTIPLQTETSLVTSFRVYTVGNILCSAKGLLLLRGVTSNSRHNLCICNPITREYIELQCPRENIPSSCWVEVIYGFGVSKESGQYKVVKLNSYDPQYEARVYDLGTGSWRRIANAPPFITSSNTTGVFVMGKLHWLLYDIDGSKLIYSFDLEAEVFSSFVSPPPSQPDYVGTQVLSAVGDCLCVCDDSAEETVIVWFMKEYGDEKSWVKEFVISKTQAMNNVDLYTSFSPIRILKDGEILMAKAGQTLFYYNRKEKSGWRIQQIPKPHHFTRLAVIHTSTFLSLRTFQMERVNFF